jgi:hypothetical protein
VRWELEKSGKYTTKSMYRFVLYPGLSDRRTLDVWGVNCPLNQKIFLWLSFRGHIQSTMQLVLRNWRGSKYCVTC